MHAFAYSCILDYMYIRKKTRVTHSLNKSRQVYLWLVTTWLSAEASLRDEPYSIACWLNFVVFKNIIAAEYYIDILLTVFSFICLFQNKSCWLKLPFPNSLNCKLDPFLSQICIWTWVRDSYCINICIYCILSVTD